MSTGSTDGQRAAGPDGPAAADVLRLRGVAKAFRGREVLAGCDADLVRGITFLMGANGAGKTTLIRCVLGLLSYDGAVTWRGRPLRGRDLSAAAVVDDDPFYPNLTGRQNLAVLAPESLHIEPYVDPARLGRRVSTYSIGERRRLSLTAALGAGADVVVLDEPTTGLDRDALGRLRADLMALRTRAVVLVTGHHLEFWDGLVDQLLLLHTGRLRVHAPVPLPEQEGGWLGRIYDTAHAGPDR